MISNVLNEWYIDAPWGKISLISWGMSTGKPILMVHGKQDSSATFIPLLELIPSSYHYVAVDLPGHGKSDPFPKGVTLQRMHFLSAVEIAIKHLAWSNFIYFGHSLGAELGLYYNAIYPGKITKFLLMDPGPPFQRARNRPQPEYFQIYFQSYFDDYEKLNINEKVYTKKGALDAVMKARDMTEQQAEVILSRNLSKVGPDQYKMSWDRRLAKLATLNLLDEHYAAIFKRNLPPTVIVMAKGTRVFRNKTDQKPNEFFKDMTKTTRNTKVVEVDGGHDVHFTNPERFSGVVCEFLEKDFNTALSKL